MNPVDNIAIVIPVYNEAAVLPVLFDRLDALVQSSTVSISIMLIDDGSTDDSALMIERYCVGRADHSALFLSRNFGHSMALTAGLSNIPADCNAVFIMDGDLQDPPELLPEFIAKMEEGYDVVYGVRTNRKEGFLKKISYKIYYRLLKKFSNVSMPLDAGDFSLVSRRVVDHLNKLPEESRYVRGLRSWVGFKQTGLEYQRPKRTNGSSKYSLRSLFKLAFNGIFNFSEFPIRFIGIVGFITVVTSLVYLAVTVYKKVVFGTVPEGFTALIFAIVLFSGVQLMSLGIIGEYILRIFFQVKQRPLYIVKSKITNGKIADE